MTADLTFLRRRGSGIGGMTITASWCCGCGVEMVNANTAVERLCGECRKLDDQALVAQMADRVAGGAEHDDADVAAEIERMQETIDLLRKDLRDYQEGFWREEGAARAYREQVGFLSAKIAQYDKRELLVQDLLRVLNEGQMYDPEGGGDFCPEDVDRAAWRVRDFKVTP